MISLLSPAKNMDFSQADGTKATDEKFYFSENTEYLISGLKKFSAKQIGKLMSISADLATLNFERFQQWDSIENEEISKSAILAFNGEVYRGLNAKEFSTDELSFANEHLLVLSGLYGLLKPLNKIKPYRLEMGLHWKITTKQKNLYTYWDNRITDALNKILIEHENKYIINLASSEYSKVIQRGRINYPVINCFFLDWKNGEFKNIMTWAKNARGVLANRIVKNGIDDPDSLKSLEFNGYKFNSQMSSSENFYFCRRDS